MSEQQKPKRRHHHVWQLYLRPWTKKGAIWCLQQGKIFQTGTTSIAVEKDFYKFQRLSDADLSFIKKLFEKSHPSAQKSFDSLLDKLMLPFRLIESHRAPSEHDGIFAKYLDEYTSNVLEELHSNVEARFIPSLQCALDGDISFYGDDERCRAFIDYLTKQYMRTKGIKERFFASSKPIGDADMTRAWSVLSFMFAQNIGASLYVERKRRTLTLLHNNTDVPFITGDQPVINLQAMGPKTSSLTIFYPLSPVIALWLGEVDEVCPYNTSELSGDEVRLLNQRVCDASYQQIFADRPAVLDSIK